MSEAKQSITFEPPVCEREFDFGGIELDPTLEQEVSLGMWVLRATVDPPIDVGELDDVEDVLWPRSQTPLRGFNVDYTPTDPALADPPVLVSRISIAYIQFVGEGGHGYPLTHEEVIDHLRHNIAPAVAGALDATMIWAEK